MLSTILTISGALIQVVLAILGVLIVTHDDWVKRNRSLVLWVFSMLAMLGVGIAIWQSRASTADVTKAQTELRTALDKINASTTEISRLTALNTGLQLGLKDSSTQIISLSKEIAGVARETIREVTGEGGYALVLPYFSQIDPVLAAKEGIVVPDVIPTTFGVINNSKYPVLSINLIISQHVPVGTGMLGTDTIGIFSGPVPDSLPGRGPTMVNARATIRKDRDNWFWTFIFSRRSDLSQRIVVTWDGQRWRQDYELTVLKNGRAHQVLHEIAKNFPYIKKPSR